MAGARPAPALTYDQASSIASYDPGPTVFVRYGIDVLDAVVDDPGLPEKFYSERLPRVRELVQRARAKVP